jgi:S1-C subfamily serine protease
MARECIERGATTFRGDGEFPSWKMGELFRADFGNYFKGPPAIVFASRLPVDRNAEECSYSLVRARQLVAQRPIDGCIVTATEGMDADVVSSSIVFVNGSIRVKAALDSVIVCDGDFESELTLAGSMIIARGTIRYGKRVRDGRLIAGEKVLPTNPDASRGPLTRVQEGQTRPFNFIQFFDPSQYGISVEAGRNAVRVKEVAARKPFAEAGVQVGDVVAAMGDLTTDSPEAFRRVLRRRIAEGNDIVFKVRRGDRPLEITVPASKFLPGE